MTNNSLKFASALATALATSTIVACGSVDMADESSVASEELGTAEQAMCANINGVDGVLAAIAVASAREMHRWLPLVDFQRNLSTGRVELTSSAYARCADRQCANTEALL